MSILDILLKISKLQVYKTITYDADDKKHEGWEGPLLDLHKNLSLIKQRKEEEWRDCLLKNKEVLDPFPDITFRDIEDALKFCKYHFSKNLTSEKCVCSCICDACTPKPIS